MDNGWSRWGRTRALLILLILAGSAAGQAPRLEQAALLERLREGGHVLVMRHASAPRQPPSQEQANADNPDAERQLDERGRRGAKALGEALRRLNIPVSEVMSSPAYRALETVRYAGFAEPVVREELSGQRGSARWLLEQAAGGGGEGNRLLVTHGRNIARAFTDVGSVEAGEMLVIEPRGDAGPSVVGSIRIDRWPEL